MRRELASERFETKLQSLSGKTMTLPVTCTVSILLSALALYARKLLDPYLGDIEPFGTFYVTVALVAWWAGWRAAMVAMVAGYLAGSWYFLPPRESLRIVDLAGWVVLLTYFFTSGTIVILSQQARMALTKLIHTNDALMEGEQRLRTLADSMPQLAWMARSDGHIFWYNQRWYDYTGTTPEQMEGWGWQSVHDPESLPKVLEIWRASINTGQPYEMEFPLRGADGVFRRFLTRAVPLKDDENHIVQWFGTNTDITEIVQAREALSRIGEELERRVQERTASLAEANSELQAFGYSVSHDLRAPLRHIDSYIHLLEKNSGSKLDDQGQKHIRIIAQAAKRMGDLIDDLLGLSRLGRATMEEREVDLSKMTDEVRHELEPEMIGRIIEWQITPLPQIRGDPNLLRSAIGNLLTNAIKYTRGKNPAIIAIGSEMPEGEVVVFVRDNGAGFDMRFVDKLFGVFQRLHRAEDFEGTGIGLASVRRVIQRHGGRTWAEGEVDRGATFYFSLPLSRVVNKKLV